MIGFYLVILVGFALALQYYLARRQQKHLVYEYRYDRPLAEPEETITLTSRVKNVSRLPIMYVGLSEYLNNEITLKDSEEKLQRHVSARFGEYRTNYVMCLMPHRQFETTLRFSLPNRGVYTLGKYYLENGDFLGLTSATKNGDLKKKIVIMPRKSEDTVQMQALGGYIGEISVQRFLMEDPVLTIGCRDYTGHEPMKSIAWTQTARTGKMLVKQYDHTVEANATVLLNLDGGTEEEKEECLRLTRSVCEELEKKRITYDFYTNGDIRTPQKSLSWLAPGLGKQHFSAIMYGLGASKLLSRSSFAQLVERCTKHRKTNNGYILITAPLNRKRQRELDRLRSFSDYDVCVLTARGGEQE